MNPRPSMPTSSTSARIGLAIAVLAIVAVACGSDEGEPAPRPGVTATGAADTTVTGATSGQLTAAFLDGRWRGAECLCTVVFDDGTYQVLVVGVSGLEAVDSGTIGLADGLVTFTSNNDSPSCEAGDERMSRYTIMSPSDTGADRVQLIPISDDCGRVTLGTTQGNARDYGQLYETLTRSS